MTETFRQAQQHPAFEAIPQDVRDKAWDRVYADYSFTPSTQPDCWPGFKEPDRSVTWSVGPLFEDFEHRFVDAEIELATRLADASRSLVGAEGALFALDWQHPGYRFSPERATPPTRESSWPIPVLPDGDYYLYIAIDFQFGWLTHPWEQSLCVFGDLLELMAPSIGTFELPILRRNGQRL